MMLKFSSQISKVDWKEYSEVTAPFNESEEALNMYYLCEYGKVQTFNFEKRE